MIRWLGLAVVMAAVLTVTQGPFADSRFAFGDVTAHKGVLQTWPYPALQSGDTSYLLVAPGKFGLQALPPAGTAVALRGTLIQRGDDRMLEVLPESVERVGIGVDDAPRQDLGEVRLRGEIVDSKCYLGVMNPGEGKVHRECAVRCISGGIPPGFAVKDSAGKTKMLLLVGADGRALRREVLDFVGEPIAIRGRLVRTGSRLVLQAEPADFVRDDAR